MSEPQSNPPAGDAGTQPTPQAKPAPAVPAPAVPVPAVPVPAGILARIEERVKHRLGPKPIRKKLTVISMLACTAALVIAGLGFLVFDLCSEFVTARSVLRTAARIAAEDSREALVSGSQPALVATLDMLMGYPQVSGAAIYMADGRAVARPANQTGAALPASIPPDVTKGAHLGFTSLRHYEPVMEGGARKGTVAVEISLSRFWAVVRVYAMIAAVIFILAIFAARNLLKRFQGMISEPIIELADLAGSVASESNYALRATRRHDDEVGQLADSFNAMLWQIQERDEALSRGRAELEANVTARTSQLQSEVLDRTQAEKALKDSEVRYRNLFESNPMPMWVMNLETLNFIAVNNAAIRHYGYSQSEFLTLSLPSITNDAEPIDVERAFRTSQKSFDGGEWRHKRRGGDIIEVHLTAHAIVFSGKVAKIVLANDVTERNRAQRQLAEMHKKLVDASRAAGMAEVATGVLHNVGNVLNSVNVSANVLADSVRASKVAGIRKVADLLEAQKGDLAAFFGPGGKGQMLPGYLATLAQQIDTEQAGRLSEIDQLTKNIAHIRDIVAMQQDHAKSTGVMENFTPRELLDEALRMTSADLQSSSVRVEVDCPETLPQLTTDRHKVLQILVNLITNAHQAMEGTPAAKRTLSVTVRSGDGSHAVMAIRDTGCGIAQENLTRVFSHGFTTKLTGHGFGLHSAANAATEIGGSLAGTSDGPGTGATFTLTLPLTQAATLGKAA